MKPHRLTNLPQTHQTRSPHHQARHIPRQDSTSLLSTANPIAFATKISVHLSQYRIWLHAHNLSHPTNFVALLTAAAQMLSRDFSDEILESNHHLPSYLFPRRLETTLNSIGDKFLIPPLRTGPKTRQHLRNREPCRHCHSADISSQTAPTVLQRILSL